MNAPWVTGRRDRICHVCGGTGPCQRWANDPLTAEWHEDLDFNLLMHRMRTLGENLKIAGALAEAYRKGQYDGWRYG